MKLYYNLKTNKCYPFIEKDNQLPNPGKLQPYSGKKLYIASDVKISGKELRKLGKKGFSITKDLEEADQIVYKSFENKKRDYSIYYFSISQDKLHLLEPLHKFAVDEFLSKHPDFVIDQFYFDAENSVMRQQYNSKGFSIYGSNYSPIEWTGYYEKETIIYNYLLRYIRSDFQGVSQENYLQLKALLDTNSKDNMQLATRIIETSDIASSAPYIYKLLSEYRRNIVRHNLHTNVDMKDVLQKLGINDLDYFSFYLEPIIKAMEAGNILSIENYKLAVEFFEFSENQRNSDYFSVDIKIPGDKLKHLNFNNEDDEEELFELYLEDTDNNE